MSSIFTYECSDGTYLEIGLDLTDKKYEFSGIRLEESLFGKIPDIQLRFRTNDELCKVGDSIYCRITNPAKNDHGSRSWKFNFYVYEITLDGLGETMIKGATCEKNFTRTLWSVSYQTINDAIQTSSSRLPIQTSPSGIISSVPDATADQAIYQKNESNYNFCTRMCNSYKENTVFGYTLEGIRFTDLTEEDYKGTITDRNEIKLTIPASFTKAKSWDNEVTEYKLNTYVTQMQCNGNIINVLSTGDTAAYKQLARNYLINQRFNDPGSYYNFRSPWILPYAVGDMIRINSNELKYDGCFITSRLIVIDKQKVTVDYTISSQKIR